MRPFGVEGRCQGWAGDDSPARTARGPGCSSAGCARLASLRRMLNLPWGDYWAHCSADPAAGESRMLRIEASRGRSQLARLPGAADGPSGRVAYAAAKAPCGICGQAIDYFSRPMGVNDPEALEIDHIKSRKTHPHLALDRRNRRPSHGRCNRSKGATSGPLGLGEASEDW